MSSMTWVLIEVEKQGSKKKNQLREGKVLGVIIEYDWRLQNQPSQLRCRQLK